MKREPANIDLPILTLLIDHKGCPCNRRLEASHTPAASLHVPYTSADSFTNETQQNSDHGNPRTSITRWPSTPGAAAAMAATRAKSSRDTLPLPLLLPLALLLLLLLVLLVLLSPPPAALEIGAELTAVWQ